MIESMDSTGDARLISREDSIKAGLKTYFTGKPCVHGHLAYRRTYDHKCAECNRLKIAKWRKDNPDYEVDRYKSDAEYRAKKISRASSYYEKNKGRVNDRKKVYQASLCRETARKKSREYLREWRGRPRSKAILFMRNCLKRMMRYKNPTRTEKVIGYSRDCLVRHIEGRFAEGMSWDNYGEWHIDHIKPISAFVREGETRPSVVHALGNLQPLWASDNLSKSSKYDGCIS